MKELLYSKHNNHLNILKEFYHYNKYILTEQMKDTLLDAINCMEYVIDKNCSNNNERDVNNNE